MDPLDLGNAALFRSLVQNSFDLTTVCDGQGNVIYASPSLQRILGYGPESVVGLNILSFVHPDDVLRVTEGFVNAVLTAGTRDPITLRVRHLDGSWRVIEAASNNLLDDPTVAGIVHNMRDVTARHLAEEAVRLNEQKLRAYLDQATDLIWTIDLEGRLTSVNAKTCSTLGYHPEEVLGRAALEFVAPESVPELGAMLTQVVMGGTIEQIEAEVIAKGGARRWLEIRGRSFSENGVVAEILQIGRDVTERKRAEGALRESEALYRSILNSSPDAVAITDLLGRIQVYSPAALTMFGFEQGADLRGHSVLQFVAPEQRQSALTRIASMAVRVIDRTLRTPDEYRAVRADGSSFDVEVLGEFICDEAGEPTRLVFDIRDITERKEAERERSRLESNLAHAQRLEAVGQLAGGVAHDFNNMLGVILASAELALISLDDSAPVREELNDIRRAAERSAELTRQLLAFARKQVIAPIPLDLNETVRPMLKMLDRLVREDTELVWNPSIEPAYVYVDPGQVDQLLANLVVNARDAITGPGTIVIAVAIVDVSDPDLLVAAGGKAGRYVEFSVSDDGAGMEEETRSRIFEPFFTTKPAGHGTGLGLATVHGIASQNHGFVNVQSALGEGTRASVYLPYRPLDHVVPVGTPGLDAGLMGDETVLLVEDEQVLLRLTSRMLVGLGYTVLACETPARAIQVARSHPGAIDLLVTDMMMPGMNGIELWRQLQHIRPGLRSLFVSGYPADVVAASSELAESLDLVPKPFSREALATRMREVLSRE